MEERESSKFQDGGSSPSGRTEFYVEQEINVSTDELNKLRVEANEAKARYDALRVQVERAFAESEKLRKEEEARRLAFELESIGSTEDAECIRNRLKNEHYLKHLMWLSETVHGGDDTIGLRDVLVRITQEPYKRLASGIFDVIAMGSVFDEDYRAECIVDVFFGVMDELRKAGVII